MFLFDFIKKYFDILNKEVVILKIFFMINLFNFYILDI